MQIWYSQVEDSKLKIKPDKRLDYLFTWGADNLYPQLVEELINSSVTAKSCVDKASKNIYGKGFGEVGSVIVNKKGQSLNEVLRISGREYSKHNNVFIHVGYNANLDINSIQVIPASLVRLGKADDKGYSGKFIVYDNWDKTKGRINTNDFQVIDRYNPNKKVIEAQISAVGGIKKYRGQILHLQQDSNAIYSLPDLNPVLGEALLEANSTTFRSRGAEQGFLNAKLMVVQPFSTAEERRKFRNTLNDLQGAENAGNVLLLESSNISDDLKNQILMEDLSNPYNDKLFEYSDKQARKNIAIAYGVPLQLVDVSESSMFGQSGELFKQARIILWESREEARMMMEEVFNSLAQRFTEDIPELEIVPLFLVNELNRPAENQTVLDNSTEEIPNEDTTQTRQSL